MHVSPAIVAHPSDGPLLATALIPLVLAIAISEVSRGRLDAKQVALLGMMVALTAALRPIGAGAMGIEPMWFLIILSGSVFGAPFGFLVGSLSLFLSAFLTGGVGPWLPFQMLAAAWIGAGAGLVTSRRVWKLVAYTVVASLFFGFAMDLQFWPWLTGTSSSLSYIAGGSVMENLQRFVLFHFASSLAWDVPRAVTNVALLLLLGRPVIHALERSRRRGSFDHQPEWEPLSGVKEGDGVQRTYPAH